jgi:peptide/nickel transport system ATP-binding protein
MEVAETTELLNDPKHPYSAALLRSLPQLGQKKDRLQVIPGSVPSAVTPPAGCRFHPRCSQSWGICSQEMPSLLELGDGRQAACHLYTA